MSLLAAPRAAPPDGSPWSGRVARIDAIRPETPGTQTYELVLRDHAAHEGFCFEPGQFNMLYLPGIGEAAISISSDPNRTDRIAHAVRAVGNVTQAVARLQVNDELVIRGPFGRPWPLAHLLDRDIVIAAGGLGIASLHAAIHHLMNRRGDYGRIAVLHGAKTPADLLYHREHALWRSYGIDVTCIVDRGDEHWHGPVGLVPDVLDRIEIEPARTTLLCCGPEPMMKGLADGGLRRGLAAADVFLSLERNMACAAGLCGLCQLGPAFVCKDGPVFSHERIAPFLAVPHL
jgi:NAD(P)H-flavin reductase